MSDVEDVTLGEIVRAIGDLRADIRALRGEHVRRDLYEAHRATFTADVERLREEFHAQRDERRNRAWQVNLAMIVAGLSLLGNFLTLIIS